MTSERKWWPWARPGKPSADLSTVVAKIIGQVRPHTMVGAGGLDFTIRSAIDCIRADRRGVIVECGAWRGGASFAMLLAQREVFGRIIKPVWMFDSFQGLPPADERDGPAARQWQSDPSGPYYFDNCTAPLDDVRQTISHFGFSDDECVVVPGWFHETLPKAIAALQAKGIALLRLDCDWYEPVSLVLETLAPALSADATVIIDDYYTWDGCARAVHDFLSRNDRCYRIRTLGAYEGAWFVKRDGRAGDAF
jgi:hypothetical protein